MGDYIVGSPEWFHNKAKSDYYIGVKDRVEEKRLSFYEQFSPSKLAGFSGSELLDKVFGVNSESMMQILMNSEKYREFGSTGYYKYLGIIYLRESDGSWIYCENNINTKLTLEEAESRAEVVRDQFLECVKEIENIGDFNTIRDYQTLKKRISNVFFYKYVWAMKYYQMIRPDVFPGMYHDHTINRALEILGLQQHAKKDRILNVGEISLFIKRCDVNNIVFNHIYSKEWGWEDDYKSKISENASINRSLNSEAVGRKNYWYYNVPIGVDETQSENLLKAAEIEEDIKKLNLQGEDREAVVKARVNQNVFRDILLKKYKKKCCLCGVSSEELLIASHIKPWADSEPEERLSENNGFLLCPNHDKLFDKGYISFNDNGNILISEELNETDRMFMNVHDKMHVEVTEGHRKYLEYHRDKVFRG
ncbi:MAG: HNH endonuclease [Lachnospiraceae bacterium]|nr:HNH endonuclease [Lachnospiraceae bacterium]